MQQQSKRSRHPPGRPSLFQNTCDKAAVAFDKSKKLGRCGLLEVEVKDAGVLRLGLLRHASANDEAKESRGRALHLPSAGGLVRKEEREKKGDEGKMKERWQAGSWREETKLDRR